MIKISKYSTPDAIDLYEDGSHKLLLRRDKDAISFGYYFIAKKDDPNDEECVFMISEPGLTHSNIIDNIYKNATYNNYKYSGRIWLDSKLMLFWQYPPFDEFKKLINDLEKELKKENYITTSLWNNDYKIIVSKSKEGIIIGDKIFKRVREKIIDLKIIPIELYIESEDVFKYAYQKHLDKTKNKEVKSQFGSKKKGLPIDVRQKIYAEKRILNFKEFLNEKINNILDKSAEEIVKYINDWSGFNSEKDAIEEINYLLNSDFPNGLKNIPDVVTLYRVLLLEDDENINESELGEHFISDKRLIDVGFLEKIGVWENWTEDSELWLLTCKTNKNNIDLERTMGNRLLYPRENEFTLKNSDEIDITDKIKLKKENIQI